MAATYRGSGELPQSVAAFAPLDADQAMSSHLKSFEAEHIRREFVAQGAFLFLQDFLTPEITAADALTRGGDVLLMDADVLYDQRIATALAAGQRPVNRVLIDRDFEAGDEPVKLCISGGVPIELRKQLAAELTYDTIGESVGFFRFDQTGARRLAALVADYVARDCAHMPHEEAVRDLLRERSQIFEVADVTGAPWIEIDFPTDVIRAAHEVLPQLLPLSEASK
jgi:choline kinase